MNKATPTYIFALGGLEEIGKNCYVIEHDDEIVIFDSGIKFANNELLGMNGMVANYSYLKENENRIVALVITHGHEDHIGGIPHLLRAVNIPIIHSPLLPSKLIERRLKENRDVKVPEIKIYDDNSSIKTKYFDIDFCRVSHSIPDSFAIAIKTPNGNIVSTGDFRFDFATNGDQTNLKKLTDLSERNIDVLLCESTSSEVAGFSESEKYIINNLRNMIINSSGRVFISTFASNLGRVEEIIAVAASLGRKIAIIGKSMESNIKTSRSIGYLEISDEDIISSKDINQYPDENILVILTGSQGEENAALSTMAKDTNNKVTLKPTDTIILSSNPIPGNYANVEALINMLYKKGVKVIENKSDCKIHSSGHATRSEQQLMIRAINPTFLFPIHGEFKMLKALVRNAKDLGFKGENILVTCNGHKLSLTNGILERTDIYVPGEAIFIDGKNTSSSSKGIIGERSVLSTHGIINICLLLNEKRNKLLSNPIISVKGCFFAKTSGSLMSKCSHLIIDTVNKYISEVSGGILDESKLKLEIEKIIKEIILKWKRKEPIIYITIFERNIEIENKKIAEGLDKIEKLKNKPIEKQEENISFQE